MIRYFVLLVVVPPMAATLAFVRMLGLYSLARKGGLTRHFDVHLTIDP